MPQVNRIIFLKDKLGAFNLRDDIKSFGYDEKRGQYYVKFNAGDRYLYYNPANVDIAELSKQLDPPFRITRKKDGEVFHHVLGVRLFIGRVCRAYRVMYENGKANNYPADYLFVEEHIDDYRSINVWEYLNEVAKFNVISIDEDNAISLADKYSNMAFVAKKSLLETYLNTETYIHEDPIKCKAPFFPFGCNRSQYKAVCNALSNRLSVIQGPPGTGKTQTILNIMANLLLAGKTMEIVSNNNSAVENIKEKLETEGLSFLCAQLGRVSNKKQFVESQSGTLPDMTSWRLENARKIAREAIDLSNELQKGYEYQEELAIIKERLSEYKKQLDSFPERVTYSRRWSPTLLKKFFRICSLDMDRRRSLRPLTKLRLRLHHLPYSNTAVNEIHYLLITERVRDMEQHCSVLQKKVEGLDVKNQRLRLLSMMVLKHYLFKKYCSRQDRTVFVQDEIYLKSKDFLKEYPIVLSTTFSATSNINPAYKFDYLIMDEASQVDIAAGALAFSCAHKAVVVGDLKQLPNVVDSHTEEIVDSIFAKYNIPEAYRYSTNSFLSSICALYPQIPQVLLREHYRCNSLIIGFCSKQFYSGELIPMKTGNDDYPPVRIIKTVKGNHARGTVNYRQVETIIQEVIPELEKAHFHDIGIIAPYNNQVEAIRMAIRESGRDYETATVHKFQGREKDAIVLSTVDNQVGEFINDPHLLNVAVSRAKKQFTLIVSSEEQPDSNIKDLINYIEYYQGGSVQSIISSVFDLLYEDYTKDLLAFYKTHKRVAEYDSENLIYWTIKEVIEENNLKHLGVIMHYPLRYLITSDSGIDQEQRRYAMRSWTHIDFLLFDSISHKARLAIEVDGTQYHKKGSAQGNRDMLKDSILKAIGLPLLRLSTDGSGEKGKILKAIQLT